MPKTLVNEIDNTSGASSSGLTNTVYIPCSITTTIKKGTKTYTFSSLEEGHTEKEILPKLIKSSLELDEFKSDIKGVFTPTTSGDGITEELTPNSLSSSFALASYLLNSGCYVLLHLVVTDTAEAWTARFAEIKDKGLYDMKFLCLGEFAESTSATASNFSGLLGVAERRGDCIALIDHPQDLSSVVLTSSEPDTYSFRAHKWAQSINSSYAALFSPWCSNSIFSTTETGSTTKVNPLLPPSYSFLIAYANSVKTNPAWLAVAGAFRGAVPGLIKVGVKYGEADIDTLQNRVVTFSGGTESFGEGDNAGTAVNPICNIDPFGVIIWGNRTGLLNGADGLKATSLLNIRNLACDIKKTMFKAARRYTFEQNTIRLWLNFCSQVRPLLDQAKVGEGIETYKLVQEETSARARLKAKVIIVPIDAVEDFELSFVLDDTIETEESAG